MASTALLGAWQGMRLLGGMELRPASMLLEFLATFLVLFGTMFVAGRVVGIIPGPAKRAGKR